MACRFSELVVDSRDPVCVEGFRDADAGASHVGTAAFENFVELAPDLVSAQPEIIYVDAPGVAGWGPIGEISPR